MASPLKIVITGAAGHIGYALLFRIASGQMLGSDQTIEFRLLEHPTRLTQLRGIAMELEDCAFPLLTKVICTSQPLEAMEGADWVILIGAAPRKAGMERADLLKVNGAIFAEQGRALNAVAPSHVRVLVVGNPCNSNAFITMQHAPRIPKRNFYAMTWLDQSRATHLLARHAKVPVDAVRRLTIWGNHSSTQYPDIHHATIYDRPVLETISDHAWLKGDEKDSFIPQVQQRGAHIIQMRGTSSAGSAAQAIIANIRALTHDTPPGEWFSVSVCSQGEYGIDPGLIFSYPCRIDHQKLNIVMNLEHNAWSQAKLHVTHDELKEERDIIQQLGLS
jgi:malate dehydrogenase